MMQNPPVVPQWILERSLPAGDTREAVLGDLAEQFQRAWTERGRAAAVRRYWFDASMVASRFWIERIRTLPRRIREARAASHHRPLARRHSVFGSLLQDVRYAMRTLTRNRGFALAAIFTMALGIGANTAVFAVVNGVLLRTLPFEDPDDIVVISGGSMLGNREVEYLRDNARTLRTVASLSPGWGYALGGGALPTQVQAGRTSANIFDMLGVSAALGRTFQPHEGQPGNGSVAVLSHALWVQQFGGDPGVIGTHVALSGAPFEVIGVMPPNFSIRGAAQHDVWVPLPMDPSAWYHSAGILQIFGRVADEAAISAVTSEIASIRSAMRQHFGESEDYAAGLEAISLEELTVGDTRSTLLLLLGAAGFILLIAGANLGGLLLARSAERQEEITVRLSLGASRGRVVRQLVTESAVLAVLGGLAGLALAYGAVPALVELLPASTPRIHEIGVDSTVLVACLVASALTGLAFGLTPALAATRTTIAQVLRAAGSGGRDGRTRGAMVVVQVALAMVLMVGAGLMMRTLHNLGSVDPGFQTAGVLTLKLQIPGSDGGRQIFEEVEQAVATLPGVVGVSTTQHFPIKESSWTAHLEVEGRPVPEGAALPRATWRSVSAPFFETLEIPLVEGRVFDARDNATAPNVVVINETLARTLFPDGDALNRRIQPLLGTPDSMSTVIGIVGDVRTVTLREPGGPVLYRPASQQPRAARTLVVRASTDPTTLVRPIRDRIWSVNSDIPISEVSTVDQVLATSVAQPRLVAVLLGAFAAVGLLLGSVGLYGVVAYSVGQRTREIGIRMALGAQPTEVSGLILRQGIALAAVGVVVGLAGAVALSRLLAGLLFQVPGLDPLTFAALAVVLLCVAGLASYLPARRASRMDAIEALGSSGS